MFDATINLGTLIQTIAIISGFVYFIWTIKVELKVVDAKQRTLIDDMKDMKIELGKLTEVTIEQVKQTARLDYMDTRLIENTNRVSALEKKTP